MDDVLNTSLLSIAQLCRIGCVATFSAKDVTVTYNNLPVLYGLKSIDDNLWTLPTLPLATASCPAAHAAGRPRAGSRIRSARLVRGRGRERSGHPVQIPPPEAKVMGGRRNFPGSRDI